MAKAYYPVNGSFKEWTPDMVGALAADGTAKQASRLANAVYVSEQSNSVGDGWYKIGSVTCMWNYGRINETYLAISRFESMLLTFRTYSNSNKQFINPYFSGTPLTSNAQAEIYEYMRVGLDKAAEGNTLSIWVKRWRYSPSFCLIPLGANIDLNYQISWKSYNTTAADSDRSAAEPTFAVPATRCLNAPIQTSSSQPTSPMCQIWIKS